MTSNMTWAGTGAERKRAAWKLMGCVLLLGGSQVCGEGSGTNAAAAPRAGEEKTFEVSPGVSMVFCWIPPTTSEEWTRISGGKDTFLMGSPTTEGGREMDEKQHEVKLTRGFWLAKHEVTQGQWKEVMGRNPSRHAAVGPDAPVEQVSWHDVQEFIGKLKGGGWRLPTETEWEYACRAGTQARFHSGDTTASVAAVAWHGENSGGASHGVGTKQGNAWGLHDMHGNVNEWCQDLYGEYGQTAAQDPGGAESGSASNRVTRGGGWIYGAKYCRAALRTPRAPDFKWNCLGFRLARDQR